MSERYGYGYGDEAARRSAVREDEPAEPPEEAGTAEEAVPDGAVEPGNGVASPAVAEAEVIEEEEEEQAAGPEEPAATAYEAEEPAAEPAEDGQAAAEEPATASVFDVAAEEEEATAAAEAPLLLEGIDPDGIRARFVEIQASFVDEPRQALQEAERYVSELVTELVDALERQRAQLRGTIEGGSTEELRLALRGYREFVDRLLGLRL